VSVGLFVPCFVDLFHPEAAIATVRLLEHLGVELAYPDAQTCCGQPQFNAGRRDDARALARRFCEIFDRFDEIVSPSGSCVAMVRKHYPSLVGDSRTATRVYELCEYLTGRLGVEELGARLPGRAAVHVGCHARREIGVAGAAVSLLSHVEGLQIVQVESDEWCCGFGGTFSVKFPEISSAMGSRKLAPILEADVDYLISTDSSCLMQLRGMVERRKLTRPRMMHVAEVLATCVRGS